MQIKDQESFFQVGVMLWCCMTKYIAINVKIIFIFFVYYVYDIILLKNSGLIII